MSREYDAIVIGAGPAGCVAALILARAGMRVAIIEKSRFPRFQIGESFLPASYDFLESLGLTEALKKIEQVPKYGAEFGIAGDEMGTFFEFATAFGDANPRTLNIRRAVFDKFLLDEAVNAGAQVIWDQVRSVLKLEDGHVSLQLAERKSPIEASCVFDASGQATVIGRHLKWRKRLDEAHLQNIAYFSHFHSVKRYEADREGFPTVAMAKEGWFWVIPIDDISTSVGLVLNADAAKQVDLPADQMLQWGIERTPLVYERMKDAVPSDDAQHYTRADYSYRCAPYAGPGFYMIGDAAAFLDPVFSSGVHLGMVWAQSAAQSFLKSQNGESPVKLRTQYAKHVTRTSGWFFRIIKLFYQHSFRELFLHGKGPLSVERAVMYVLSGRVHPEPAFPIRWRFRMFELFVWINNFLPIVPRREVFSLFDAQPIVQSEKQASPGSPPMAQTTAS